MTSLAYALSDPAVVAHRRLVRIPRAPDLRLSFTTETIMIGVGLAVGFRFHSSPLEVVAGIGLMLLFGYAFSWIFAYCGLTASSGESAQAIGFIVIFPITFVSSAFVPPDSMPSWLQPIADNNPFTTVVDAMRALWVDAPAGNDIWAAVLWSLGLIAVFAPLSVARYRRAVSA